MKGRIVIITGSPGTGKTTVIHYIILRAGKDETLRRAISRDKLGQDANTELVESMWHQFDNLGEFEKYVVDASVSSPDVTALHVDEGIISGRFRL